MRISVALFGAGLAIAAALGPVAAQISGQEQSPIRERNDAIRARTQDEINHAAREQAIRERAARDAEMRLNQSNRDALQPRPVPPGARDDRPLPPGPAADTDRAGNMMREDAARRQQLEYDRALRESLDASRAAGSAGQNNGTWRPIGAGRN